MHNIIKNSTTLTDSELLPVEVIGLIQGTPHYFIHLMQWMYETYNQGISNLTISNWWRERLFSLSSFIQFLASIVVMLYNAVHKLQIFIVDKELKIENENYIRTYEYVVLT